jgi:hypothetical protein
VRALAVSNQELLGFPPKHLLTRGPSSLAPQKAEPPFAWSTALISYQTIEPHHESFPAFCISLRKPLDQVTDEGRTRFSMKEGDFLHHERPVKNHLIDIHCPCRIGIVIERRIEAKIRLPFRQARWRI